MCVYYVTVHEISPDFLPLGLLLLQPLELFLLLGSLFPPLIDVFFELLVQLALLGFLAGLEEVSISPSKNKSHILLKCHQFAFSSRHYLVSLFI